MADYDPTAVTLYASKGQPFIVDADDAFSVGRYCWYIDEMGYPRTAIGKHRRRSVRLHEFLLGRAPNGLEWDHENRIKTDNRRRNLRPATRAVNARNTGVRITNRSGVPGVKVGRHGGWEVTITVNGRLKWVGTFADLADATVARKAAEEKHWRQAVPQ